MTDETEQLQKTIAELERKLKEQESIERSLEESEERFKILFEFAPEAYFLSNLNGVFIDGNQAAEKILGYKKQELIGKNMLKLNLVSADQIPEIIKRLAQHVTGKPTIAGEFILNRKDGTKVATNILGAIVKIRGKMIILGIVRDITERKKKEEELRSKNLELEKFNKLSVGREIRMIELKKRIIELEKKLEITK